MFPYVSDPLSILDYYFLISRFLSLYRIRLVCMPGLGIGPCVYAHMANSSSGLIAVLLSHLFNDLSRFKFINTSLTSLTCPRDPEAPLCVASRRYFYLCLLYDTILGTIVILGPDYDMMPWSFGYLSSFTALDQLVSRHITAIGNKYNCENGCCMNNDLIFFFHCNTLESSGYHRDSLPRKVLSDE